MNKILFNFFYWIFNRRYFWEQEAEIDERHAQFDCDSRWYRIVKYTHIEEYSSEFEGGTTVILGKLWIGRISYDDDNGYSYYKCQSRNMMLYIKDCLDKVQLDRGIANGTI